MWKSFWRFTTSSMRKVRTLPLSLALTSLGWQQIKEWEEFNGWLSDLPYHRLLTSSLAIPRSSFALWVVPLMSRRRPTSGASSGSVSSSSDPSS
jgi:hypothetical protein